MSSLHDVAIRQYTEHYARGNPTLDVAKLPQRTYRNMEMMYGPLVDRLIPGQTVADLGCGVGFLLHWLAGRSSLRLVGVDSSECQAQLARRAVPKAEIICEDALSFVCHRQEKFNAVFCTDMLEHLETDEQCFSLLQAILEALEPGGFFICRVPNAAHILGSYSRYMDITHHRSFTSHSLHQALTAAGFSDLRLIPTRSSSYLGKFRLNLEYFLHRSLYLLGGYTMADTFTQNVIMVGFKS
jgi:2-polyprenyl-3-methyl-5-hydroxy-6-metoxy-1,4-benzoquinol methylase